MPQQNDPTARQPTRLDPATIHDPYPRYEQLRAEDPVHWNAGIQVWVLTRYQDVLDALRNPLLSSVTIPTLFRQAGSSDEALEQTFLDMMLFSDPPNHTRLRSLANKAFTPNVLAGIRAQIQDHVDSLLDNVQDRGSMEVISDLAYPLPSVVISELLGVAEGDQDRFKKWTNVLAEFLGNIREASDNLGAARQTVAELNGFLRETVAKRRAEPKDDLLSALVTAEDQGDSFSEDELYSMCIMLIFAGHETTTNLIGNGILALLENPSQLELLRSQPSLIESAVEEIIRQNGPVQSISRIALEDFQLGDKQIAKGDRISLTLGAANRDPERYTDPDRFNIERTEGRHIGFGFGIHFCLGAALARMEGQAAISTVALRMPELRLAEQELEWRNNPVLRGLKGLLVTF
ncbi:MAG: cytochrome P450 [Chloroflexi bacterium]|nr:cytochrome P450 [Chloroflexota bacterium]